MQHRHMTHTSTYHGDRLVSRSVSASEPSCVLGCVGKLKSLSQHHVNNFFTTKQNTFDLYVSACLHASLRDRDTRTLKSVYIFRLTALRLCVETTNLNISTLPSTALRCCMYIKHSHLPCLWFKRECLTIKGVMNMFRLLWCAVM